MNDTERLVSEQKGRGGNSITCRRRMTLCAVSFVKTDIEQLVYWEIKSSKPYVAIQHCSTKILQEAAVSV